MSEFNLGKTAFPLGKTAFPLGETAFPLGKTTFLRSHSSFAGKPTCGADPQTEIGSPFCGNLLL